MPAADHARRELAARLLPLLDLTSLGEDDTPARIEALCSSARTRHGLPAALCVYPEHVISVLRRMHATPVKVATVVIFPDGGSDAARASRWHSPPSWCDRWSSWVACPGCSATATPRVPKSCNASAHEDTFGLDRLYETCKLARKLVAKYNIGRVIARPFVGLVETGFVRTGNRHDYALPPPAPTLLDAVVAAGGEVIAIGKIADSFANRSVSRHVPAHGHDALFDATLMAVSTRACLNFSP